MGWSIGFDPNWKRDVGYGVPAFCDHPGCSAEIDRGLSYVCGGQPYGGERGCGLFFCGDHMGAGSQLCPRCHNHREPYPPEPEHPEWIAWKLTDPSWERWREEHPAEVAALVAAGAPAGTEETKS